MIRRTFSSKKSVKLEIPGITEEIAFIYPDLEISTRRIAVSHTENHVSCNTFPDINNNITDIFIFSGLPCDRNILKNFKAFEPLNSTNFIKSTISFTGFQCNFPKYDLIFGRRREFIIHFIDGIFRSTSLESVAPDFNLSNINPVIFLNIQDKINIVSIRKPLEIRRNFKFNKTFIPIEFFQSFHTFRVFGSIKKFS